MGHRVAILCLNTGSSRCRLFQHLLRAAVMVVAPGSPVLLRAVPFVLRVVIPQVLVLEHLFHLLHPTQLGQLLQHAVLQALLADRLAALLCRLRVDHENCIGRLWLILLSISQCQLGLHEV